MIGRRLQRWPEPGSMLLVAPVRAGDVETVAPGVIDAGQPDHGFDIGPIATTVAHVSRLPTWAVAGMRMPPADRRSPSLPSSFTSTRSLSILIGSFSSSMATTRQGTVTGEARPPASERTTRA